MCGLEQDEPMQLETKFLRLRMSVTVVSRFGDWEICWLGGWTRHRLRFVAMLVRDLSGARDSRLMRSTATTSGIKSINSLAL
jgi:hypothetical protein